MEASLDKRELERLIKRLDAAPEILRKAKKEALEAAAPKLKELTDQSFPLAGLHGATGKVKGWQESHVGSKGGYAAVRPKTKFYTEPAKKSGKRYAVGAVTSAIVQGHKYPSPSGRAKRYRPRIKQARMKVRAYPFYAEAKKSVPDVAQEAAQQVVQTLIHHLEG